MNAPSATRPLLQMTPHGLTRWVQRSGQEPHRVQVAWQRAVFRGTARIPKWHHHGSFAAYGFEVPGTGIVLVVAYTPGGRGHHGRPATRQEYRLVSCWPTRWWARRVHRESQRGTRR